MNTARPSSAPSSSRRPVLAAMAGGTVVSLGLVAASQWLPLLVWAAVLVALAAGVVAVLAAWREFGAWRDRVQAESAAERAEHREHTRQLHARQREVLAVVDARVQSLHLSLGQTRTSLGEARVALGEANGQVSRLKGDNEALRVQNKALRVENAGLRSQLARAEASGADVVELPRRRANGEGTEWDLLQAPTVVDLDLQRLASPFVAEVQRRHAN